ncbi:MAG: hypothetical protein DRJ08_03350 [Acidobacteria bacterium]|nr:MAG: hypothetical protein DRJ08_03350 [Acidobacteriota bacterium]
MNDNGKMRVRFILISILLLFSFTMAFSHPIFVKLTKRTVSDDGSLSFVVFGNSPREHLKLPDINLSKAEFFEEYYTDTESDDPQISIMVMRFPDKDLLYIDKNNDEDLTDDGPPAVFPKNQNDFIFGIVGAKDKKQVTRILLRRWLISRDSGEKKPGHFGIYDSRGNLNREIVTHFAGRYPGFKGEAGSYYLDYRVNVSRGIVRFPDETFQVGIFDANNNGLFNDGNGENPDLLLIDLNRDGKMSGLNPEEALYYDEGFKIGSQRYSLTEVDPYGRFIKITRATGKEKLPLLERMGGDTLKSTSTFKLNPGFWKLSFSDVIHTKTKLHKPDGKYILLNIWGEWCAPCVEEISELLAIQKQYSGQLVVISFVEVNRIENVKKMIAKRHMDWPQLILTGNLRHEFHIQMYPTNILISPDGQILFYKHQIKRSTATPYLEGEK